MPMVYGMGKWEPEHTKECRICGREFETSARTAKYCPDCRKEVEKGRKKNR